MTTPNQPAEDHPAVTAAWDALRASYWPDREEYRACARAVAPVVLRWAAERLRAEAKIADDPTWNSLLGAVDVLKDEITAMGRAAGATEVKP